MSIKMSIVNEDGLIATEPNTLKPRQDAHPVWKARNAIALSKGKWLYAPDKGHDLDQYANQKCTIDKIDEFEKSVRFYLSPYGPEITDRIINRGTLGLSINITKETLNNG